ncbi:MAG: hypothetical protein M3N98_02270 [Actinomycetota bacterium]|nr:hypothetical protein [Actinomycetota bacterium]
MNASTMKPFTGGLLDFEVDADLMEGDVLSAHDRRGARYLLAHTSAYTWLCALVSELTLHRVASGEADLRDVFTRTATGLVERIVVRDSVVCDESLLLCRELADDELPRPGVRLCCPGRAA